MQPNEGVCLEPVSADAVTSVDQGHAHVGMVGERIGERHPHGAGTHHEVVRFDRAHHDSHGGTAATGPSMAHVGEGRSWTLMDVRSMT